MFQWSVPCGQNEVYVMSEKCFLVGILNGILNDYSLFYLLKIKCKNRLL